MAKHLTMSLTPSLMSKDFFTNTSQILVRNSLPWSSPNLGNTQYWWKPMIN